jgi:hypothetical protein
MRSRLHLSLLTLVTAGALVFAAATAFAQGGSSGNYDPIQVTCAGGGSLSNGTNFIDLLVKAGPTGAPAGFSLQWMSVADYEANGSQWYSSDDPRLCKMSFSGQPSFSGNVAFTRWELGANGSVAIRLGDALFDETGVSGSLGPDLFEGACGFDCGQEYYFRAFAHGSRFSGRSCFSWAGVGSTGAPGNCPSGPAQTSDNGNPAAAEMTEPGSSCATSTDCGGCTFTQGYWKTHGSGDCHSGNNSDVWCVSSLTLGTVSYTKDQLCSILNAPAKGNGLLSLAHQLIAAKLNAACGGAECDGADITTADNFIGSKIIPPVGTASVKPGALPAGLVTALDNFNNGIGCANHCAGSKAAGPNRAQGTGKTVRWGELKVRYR